MKSRLTVEERFWAKVDKVSGPEHPTLGRCWVWTGGTTVHGYGVFTGGPAPGQLCGAHRFSLALVGGPIKDGLFVLHRCDNPPCVNPAHLFEGTHRDNVSDMKAKGRTNAGPGLAVMNQMARTREPSGRFAREAT